MTSDNPEPPPCRLTTTYLGACLQALRCNTLPLLRNSMPITWCCWNCPDRFSDLQYGQDLNVGTKDSFRK